MNTNIEAIINNFAKTNKVGKAKAEAFANEILASVKPKAETERTRSGKMGRPVMDKTKELHQAIIQTVNNGFRARRDAVLVRNLVGVDNVTFNNAVRTLVKQGKLYHAGKAHTGRKGRQPYILTTVKPE